MWAFIFETLLFCEYFYSLWWDGSLSKLYCCICSMVCSRHVTNHGWVLFFYAGLHPVSICLSWWGLKEYDLKSRYIQQNTFVDWRFMFTGRRCALWWEASANPSEPCRAALPSVWHPEVSKWPRHEWGARAPLWDGPETGWPCSGSVWRKPGEKKKANW